MLLGYNHDLSLELLQGKKLSVNFTSEKCMRYFTCLHHKATCPIQMHKCIIFLHNSLAKIFSCSSRQVVRYFLLSEQEICPSQTFGQVKVSYLSTCQKTLKPAISKHCIWVIVLLGSFSFVSLLTLSLLERPEAANRKCPVFSKSGQKHPR